MAEVLGAICSIFSIILLGWVLRMRSIIDAPYLATANRIVFYIAIPAMMFTEMTKAPFGANFHLGAALCLFFAAAMAAILSIAVSRSFDMPPRRRATFAQSSFHGNLGYLAFAIAYYVLGEGRFATTAILSSFLVVGQNVLSVWMLTIMKEGRKPEKKERWRMAGEIILHVVQNPIILSVLASIAYSSAGVPLPGPLGRTLDMLSAMALPTALLLIGASLSFRSLRSMGREVLLVALLKLICLPLIGWTLMSAIGTPESLKISGIILLAAPTATVSYVMAMELGGDPELAANCVSVLTPLSALTYLGLLWILT